MADYQREVNYRGIRSSIVPGYYYTFDYYFDKNNPNYHDDEIQYWDLAPLVLIYDTDVTESGQRVAWGFNFHLAPVEVRAKILGPKTAATDEKIPKSNANWDNVAESNPAFGVIVRQYRLDRMRNIYKVGPNGFRELCNFKSPTYYKSTYGNVVQNFYEKLRNR